MECERSANCFGMKQDGLGAQMCSCFQNPFLPPAQFVDLFVPCSPARPGAVKDCAPVPAGVSPCLSQKAHLLSLRLRLKWSKRQTCRWCSPLGSRWGCLVSQHAGWCGVVCRAGGHAPAQPVRLHGGYLNAGGRQHLPEDAFLSGAGLWGNFVGFKGIDVTPLADTDTLIYVPMCMTSTQPPLNPPPWPALRRCNEVTLIPSWSQSTHTHHMHNFSTKDNCWDVYDLNLRQLHMHLVFPSNCLVI